MEQVPSYIVVRDTDLETLSESVNARIEEGYELAGPLFCVPAYREEAPLFVQPLTLAAAEEEEETEDEDEDEYDEEAEDQDDARASEDVVVYRRGR